MYMYSCNLYTCYHYLDSCRLKAEELHVTSSVTAGGVVIHWTLLGSAELSKCHKRMNGCASEVAKLVILCRNSSSSSSLISAQPCVRLHLDIDREHAGTGKAGPAK